MARTSISVPTTFNVDNVNGTDTPGAGTFKTIQYAIDQICNNYDLAAQATIKLAATGTVYAEAVEVRRYVSSTGWRAGQYTYPRIQGDTNNNAAVVIRPSNGWAVTGVNALPWVIDSLTVASENAGGINSDACSHLLGVNLNFGQVGTAPNCCQILAQHKGFYEHIVSGFTISGGGWCHVYSHIQGLVKLQSPVVAPILNAPTFEWFAIADGISGIDYSGISWSGRLANSRYRPVYCSSDSWMSPFPSAPPWP